MGIENFDEDFYPDDEDLDNNEGDIDYYECLSCGNTQNDNDWGGQCNKCTACCLEPVFI